VLQSSHELRTIDPILERFTAINKDDRNLLAVLRIECGLFGNVDFAQRKGVRCL
jgi:hypothetical protein